MKRLILVAGAVLSLAACATPNEPQPGIYETPISADRLRIVHRAPQGLAPAYAEDAALLRAAERTVQGGYDWFVVDNRYTEVEAGSRRGNGPFISIGGGSTDFGRRSAVGVGGGIGFNLGGGGSNPSAVTTIEIRMGRGAPPAGAYNARDVQRTIGSRMSSGYPW